MPLHDFNPKLSDEAREAISAAFDAIAECHNEVAASLVRRSLRRSPRPLECSDGRIRSFLA